MLLKDSDPRLSKTLTLAEFNIAFGVFRDVICEVFPARREELDTYLAIISDLAMTYGGALFYEYHKSFSAKAAMYIQRFNQRSEPHQQASHGTSGPLLFHLWLLFSFPQSVPQNYY